MPTEHESGEEFEQPTPVVGDGNDDGNEDQEMEGQNMAIDLPQNVAGMLLKEGSESHQALMTDIRANASNVHNLARQGAVKTHNEIGTIESRANSGLIATPVASPTTQQGQ